MIWYLNSEPVQKTQECAVPLGIQGENGVLQYTADVSDWLALWPSGVVALVLQAPDKSEPYMGNTSIDTTTGLVTWTITEFDTAQVGYGAGELRIVENGIVKKSYRFATYIRPSILASAAEPPAPVPDWITNFLETAESVNVAAAEAQQAVQDVTTEGEAQIAAIEAKGQETIADVQSTIASAQEAIDGIEAQRQTMIQAIASVAGQGTDTTLTQSGIAADAKAAGDKISDLKSAVDVFGEKAPNLYDADDVVIGKNWAGGDAANRAYIQIPATAGKTYTVVIPTNVNIPQVAIISLNSAPSSLGSFYVMGGNKSTFTAVANCVNIRIQFEGSTTLAASDFDNYDVFVFEGTEEYLTAIDKIAREKLPIDRKYIFIGDSYCEGYNPDGNVTGWGERLKNAMGLTNSNCIIKYKGGAGFYHVSGEKTFLTLLDEVGNGIDKTAITDIVVCGGLNDNSESVSNVYFNGVLAFATKVSNEYPNATLYVGMIGASNDADVKSRLQSVVLYSYQYGALRKNYRYLNMVEYALAVANLASDGIHPNADGQVEITLAIKQALETGCAGLPYRFYNTIKTN